MAEAEPKNFWKENGAALIALAVIGLLPFLHVLFSGKILFASDQVESYAWKPYFDGLSRGELMLWNPFGLAGMPTWDALAGDGTYPITWLVALILPITHFITYNFILHVLIAGFSAFWLARRFFALDRLFALGVGAAYMLNTNFISHIHAGHTGKFYIMAWLPLSLYFLLRTLQPGARWRHPLGLAATVALMVTTSHLQLTYYVLMGYFLYYAFKVGVSLKAKAWKDAGALTGKFWIPVLLGIGLAFPVFYPPTQYNKHYSVRGEVFNQKAGKQEGGQDRQSYDHATSWSIHPEEAASLVVPEFGGLNERYWGRNFFKLNSEYPGIAILFLGVFGLAALRRKWLWFWGSVGLVAIVYGLGANTPLFHLIYNFIPGVKSFRAPSMMLFWLAMALTMMAAHAMAILSGGEGGIASERRAHLAKRLAQIGFGVAGALALAGFAASATYGIWDTFMDTRAIQNLERRAMNLDSFGFGAIKNAVLLAVLIETLRRWLLDSSKSLGFGLAFLAVACADLYITNRHFIQAVEALKGEKDLGRVFNLPGTPKRTFFQYHGIETLGGWADNEYGVYREFRGFDYQGNPNFAQGIVMDPADGSVRGNVFLDLLNATHITYALQDRPGTQVARNRSALPRAWFVTRWESVPADQVIDRLKAPGFDPRALAYVSEARELPPSKAAEVPAPAPTPSPADSAAPGDSASAAAAAPAPTAPPAAPQADIVAVSRTFNRHVYKVKAPESGLLVFSELWFPWWKATVDGKDAESLRIDFALRGVHIPAGDHEVVYAYRSGWLRTGFLAMGASALGLGLMAFAFHALSRRTRAGATA
jgi:hypothetical protein